MARTRVTRAAFQRESDPGLGQLGQASKGSLITSGGADLSLGMEQKDRLVLESLIEIAGVVDVLCSYLFGDRLTTPRKEVHSEIRERHRVCDQDGL